MSQAILEERVGALENDVSRLRTDVAVMARDVTDMKSQGNAILTALQTLEKREATRPQPLSWKIIGATVISMAAIFTAVANGTDWAVEHSSIVREMDRRLTRLDDPETGKVAKLEGVFSWAPTLKKDRDRGQ